MSSSVETLTVVELDIVPVDEVSYCFVDSQVSAIPVLSRREPGCDGGVGQDVVAWVKGDH